MNLYGDETIMLKGDVSGVIRIKDFPVYGEPIKDRNGADVYTIPDGISILSYDHENAKMVYKPAHYFTHEKDSQVVEVRTKNKNVIVSDNESLAVFDPATGKLIKKAPADSVGDYVPIAKHIPRIGNAALGRDVGWWIGAYVSDGWVSGNTVGYAKVEKAKRDEFIRITRHSICENFTAHEYSGKAGDKKYGGSVKLHLNSKELADTVRGFNLTADNEGGRAALYKQIPYELLINQDDEFLYGVLSGLLDGDGSIVRNTSAKKVRYNFRFSTSSEKLVESIKLLCQLLGIRYTVTVTPPRGNSSTAYIVSFSTIDMKQHAHKLTCVGESEKKILSEFIKSEVGSSAIDVIPMSEQEAKALKDIALKHKWMGVYGAAGNQKSKCPHINRDRLLKFFRDIGNIPDNLKALHKRVISNDVVWEAVKNVDYLDKRDVYDLQIDDTKVFYAGDGFIIWDTMSVHVPSTPAAVQEAKQLMPTKNMIKFGQNSLFIMPQTEVLLGIYVMSKVKGRKVKGAYSNVDAALRAYNEGNLDLNQLTKISGVKTSLGNYLLVQTLPPKYRVYNKEWDAKFVRDLLTKIYKEDPAQTESVLNKIKDLGNKYGTDLRPSINYKDLEPNKKLQPLLFKPKGTEKIEKQLTKTDNIFATFATKGIRGKPSQARQILVGPGKAVSIRGKTYSGIKSAYASGLTPIEYYKAMFGARQGAINKNKMTRDPGAFNKELAANYVPMVITTKESKDPGKKVSINLPNLTSRFLAQDVKYKKTTIGKRGQLITPAMANEFKKRHIKSVYVMDPLTDTTPNGIAAKSFGLLPDGKLPEVGTNIGILATHSITEPLSQSTLSAFHTGGIKSGETGLEHVWGLFRSVHRPDDAILAYSKGTITKIEKMAKGGYKIYVDDDPYICPPTNKPIVKQGQHVDRGDALTDGRINQKDLMELKGPAPTREYMLNQLKQALGPGYKDDRFLEVLVRGATDKIIITDPGDNLWLDKGDITSAAFIDDVNRTKKAEIPIAYSEGSILAEPVKEVGLHKGKRIDKKAVEKLKRAGIDKVTVKATPIKYKHIIISTAHGITESGNWLEAMNFSNLANILKGGASSGAVANVGEPSPIPRYITGKPLFGHGK